MVKLAIAGLSKIGLTHLIEAQKLEGVEVVAIAERRQDRLAAIGNRYNVQHRYSDAMEMIDKGEYDALVVALPTNWHAVASIRAMKLGKDVLVEKPAAPNSSIARGMADWQRKTGKKLVVGMNQRYYPGRETLKLAIEKIGKVNYIHAAWKYSDVGNAPFERGAWFLNRNYSGGGPLMDIGIHVLDLAMSYVDFPVPVSASGECFYGIGSNKNPLYTHEDMAVGFVRFKGPIALLIEASYYCGASLPIERYVDVYAESGNILGDLAYIRRDGKREEIERGNERESMVSRFCGVIRGEYETYPTIEQAISCIEIIEAVYESARTRREVQFWR